MSPTPRTTLFTQLARLRVWAERTLDWLLEPIVVIIDNRHRFRTGAQNNLELGRKNFAEGSIKDARTRFKLALLFDKDNAVAWAELARCHHRLMNAPEAAKAAQKARSLAPGDAEVAALLAELAAPPN